MALTGFRYLITVYFNRSLRQFARLSLRHSQLRKKLQASNFRLTVCAVGSELLYRFPAAL